MDIGKLKELLSDTQKFCESNSKRVCDKADMLAGRLASQIVALAAKQVEERGDIPLAKGREWAIDPEFLSKVKQAQVGDFRTDLEEIETATIRERLELLKNNLTENQLAARTADEARLHFIERIDSILRNYPRAALARQAEGRKP